MAYYSLSAKIKCYKAFEEKSNIAITFFEASKLVRRKDVSG